MLLPHSCFLLVVLLLLKFQYIDLQSVDDSACKFQWQFVKNGFACTFNQTVTLYRTGQFYLNVKTDFQRNDVDYRWWKISFVSDPIQISNNPAIMIQYSRLANSLTYSYENSGKVISLYSNKTIIDATAIDLIILSSTNVQTNIQDEAGVDLITHLLTRSLNGDTCVNLKLESGQQSTSLDFIQLNSLEFCAKNCFGYVSRCTADYCLNGGKCLDVNGEPYCNCTQDYLGNNCEYINYCQSAPCFNNGVCNPQLNGYTCTCYPNTSGPNCKTILWCLTNPCKNNGVCIPDQETSTSFKCRCNETRYTGSLCETQIIQPAARIVNDTQFYYDLFKQFNKQNCYNWSTRQLKTLCSEQSEFSVRQKLVEENTLVILNVNKVCETYCKTTSTACEDMHKNCNTWKNLGLCTKIKTQYPAYCKKTCEAC